MIRDIAANYFGNFMPKIIYLIVLPIMARTLGTEAVGVIGLQVLMFSVTALLHQSLGKAANRICAQWRSKASKSDADTLAGIEQAFWFLGIFVAATTVAGRSQIVTYWLTETKMPRDTVETAVALIGIMSAFQIIQIFYYNGLLGFGRHTAANSIMGIGETVRYGGIIPLLFAGATLAEVLIWQLVLAGAQNAVMAFVFWNRAPAPHPRTFTMPKALKEVRHFAAGMSLITILGVLTSQADRIIVSGLMPLSVFGEYTIVSNLARTIPLLVAPISNVFFPRLTSDMAAREKHLESDYHAYAQILAVVSVPTGIFATYYSADLLRLYVGAAPWLPQVTPALGILALGMMLAALYEAPYVFQLASGWTSLHIKLLTGLLVPILAANWVMAKLSGLSGVAMVSVWLSLGYLVIGVPVMHRRLLKGEARKWLLQDILRPIGMTLLFCLASGCITSFFQQPLCKICIAALFGMISMATIASVSPEARSHGKLIFDRIVGFAHALNQRE